MKRSRSDTTSALTRVSRERDVFTDDDHKALDAVILKTFRAFRVINEEPNLPALLTNITIDDERLTTFTRKEADELLTRETSIAKVLRNAWQAGSFKEVRQLGVYAVRFLPMF